MITDLSEYEEHTVQELICLKCNYRYIGVYPSKIWLKDLTCQKCNTRGLIIATGQSIEENYEKNK